MGTSDVVQRSINIFSRVIALIVLFLLPGLLGWLADRQFGTSFISVLGWIVGVAFGILAGWRLLQEIQRSSREELRQYEAGASQRRGSEADDSSMENR